MTADPWATFLDAWTAAGGSPRGGDRQKYGRCPAHEDRSPSLSAHYGPPKPTAKSQVDRVSLTCHAGCTVEQVCSALGLRVEDLFDKDDEQRTTVETDVFYPYYDAQGSLVYEVVRKPGKRFWQCQPDGRGGREWNIKGVTPVPYRLPQLIEAVADERVVWIAEGERDVASLVYRGLVATCNSGGAGKWTREHHARWLRGADVIVVADKDPKGRAHAETVVRSLLAESAHSIEVVEAAHGKDATDHFRGGYRSIDFVSVGTPRPWTWREGQPWEW